MAVATQDNRGTIGHDGNSKRHTWKRFKERVKADPANAQRSTEMVGILDLHLDTYRK